MSFTAKEEAALQVDWVHPKLGRMTTPEDCLRLRIGRALTCFEAGLKPCNVCRKAGHE